MDGGCGVLIAVRKNEMIEIQKRRWNTEGVCDVWMSVKLHDLRNLYICCVHIGQRNENKVSVFLKNLKLRIQAKDPHGIFLIVGNFNVPSYDIKVESKSKIKKTMEKFHFKQQNIILDDVGQVEDLIFSNSLLQIQEASECLINSDYSQKPISIAIIRDKENVMTHMKPTKTTK